MAANLDPIRPGPAHGLKQWLNDFLAEALAQRNLTVGDGLWVELQPDHILLGRSVGDSGFWALLGSETSSPYSFTEAVDAPDGTFAALTGTGRTGTNAYEVNDVEDLAGTVQWLIPSSVGDYRFQVVRKGEAECTGTICVKVTGCGENLAGVAFHVTGPNSYDETCNTDSDGECCVDITEAGTYNWTLTKAGWETESDDLSAGCTENDLGTVGLSPDEDHTCAPDCCGGVVLPTELIMTDSVYGAVTLTFDGTDTWKGCQDVGPIPGLSRPSCPGLGVAGGTVGLEYQLKCDGFVGGFVLSLVSPRCSGADTLPLQLGCSALPWSFPLAFISPSQDEASTCDPFYWHATFLGATTANPYYNVDVEFTVTD